MERQQQQILTRILWIVLGIFALPVYLMSVLIHYLADPLLRLLKSVLEKIQPAATKGMTILPSLVYELVTENPTPAEFIKLIKEEFKKSKKS